MKKIFGFGSKKGESPSGSSINPVRDSSHGINFQPGYRIRDKDLRKIHKAAIVGNVAKVQHVVLFGENGLNDKDKMNRTALHLACANGHSAVVTLLLERKCLLNLCDNENRTALMKAVECQEEECATLLLEHGADPNVMDVSGNTALHYAVFCQNISLTAKLLSYDANIEARNKDDLTPLLLAICERSGVMVEFLVTKKANIHAVDKMKRTALMLAVKYELPDVVRLLLQQGADIVSQDVFGWTAEEYAVISGFNIFRQLISEYKEKRSKTSPENSNPVDESSEEHSSRRFPNKPGVDLGHTSNDEVLGFKTEHVLKPKLMKLMKASQQSKRNKAKCGILRPESIAFSQDNNSGSNVEDVVETFPKPSPWFEGICHPAFPLPELVPKLLKSVAGLGRTKQSVSESLPRKYVDHLPGTAGQRGKKTLNGQVEDSPGKYPNVKPAVRMKESVPNKTVRMKDFQTSSSDLSRELDLKLITEEEQEKLDEDENDHAQNADLKNKAIQDWFQKPLHADNCSASDSKTMEPELENGNSSPPNSHGASEMYVEEKKHKSSEVEVSENVCDAADESGLFLQRKHGGNSNQEFPAMQNEGSDSLRTSLSISHEAGLVVMNSISDSGVHREGVKEKHADTWMLEERAIAPILEKTESLTGGLLHANGDGILREVDQGDGRPARKTPYEKKKVKEQINYENDLDDLTQSSKTVSEDGDGLYSTSSRLEIEPLDVGRKDSVSLLKIQDTILPHERLVGFQRSHCELLRGEFYKMKSKVRGLQKELSETREMKSQLEHQKVEWERKLGSLRFTLKQEDENRRNADMLCEKMREHLRRKEDECSKEVEVKQQLELTLQAVKVKLKTEKNNLNQVSDSCEKAKDLLCKNHMLQEEIAMLRLERDALKNQHRENEENYFKDIEILKVQNDDLQKTINLDEETLTKTVSHYTGQLNALTAENAMLNSKLENEKESKQRLETEVESYSSRLAAALHDRDQGQTSKRDLELAFRRARDEWLRLQDKMKSDVANLKDNNEMLSQQLSTVESKFNKLKIKLHHTRDDLREKTLMLEHVQRDLNQAECQKQDIEHVYRNQQGKVNTYLGKQESLERLSQLQSENMLLRQQLDDVRNRADSREKTVISIQDQFQQIMRKLQAEREKQGVMLEERNKELVKERNHLKERMCQYENEKAEGEAVVRQLQQELDDAVKKQSMLEASLRVMSRYCPKLEAEAQDLKNNCKLHPRQVTSQTQAGFQQMEVRIKDLESELSKMKSLQEDSNKAELEKYKQLYLVECELIKSLEDKLDKTHQRLAVVSTKLEVEKQQNRSLFKTVTTRPVLEPPCVGNFNNPLVLNGNLTPRANVGFSTSIPHPSNNSMETYLTKMRRELDRSIARALREE
ncbi:ankyrin repeat domain-containing protein 62 isoform X2 [Bubalus bubalis]|uniref:ankyrin repeat domain-containing protein 62 isoform X2 n=1 Tax=Bubalus bubalis TaxID=89462 RepID=UPI001E1B66E5|nr:ankyrin repeat domain-containing protein 62 isoform X2 [Bubalus bubalis]